MSSPTYQNALLEWYTLGVHENLIVALLPTDEFYNFYQSKQRHNFQQHHYILLPGFINAHTHLPLTMLRGYADDLPLKTWIENWMWPTEGHFMSSQFIEYGTQLAVYELLRSGTTLVNDMFHHHEKVIEVCEKTHIRIMTGKPLIDLGQNDTEKQVQEAIEFVENWNQELHPLVTPSIAPHALYTFPLHFIQKASDFCKQKNITLHMHLNEIEEESPHFFEKHQMSTIEALDSIGAISSNSVFAHCVWLNKSEIQLLSERKANVCHCVRSNCKLGSGICPVPQLLKAGVNVCLGTDSSSSNNSLNMLLEAQTASLMAKGYTRDATTMDAYTVLKMATINGAKALGMDKELGTLEVGKLADFICFDLGDVDNFPIYDPLSQLLFGNAHLALHVWINGKQVVENKKITTFQLDLERISQMATEIKSFRKTLQTKSKKAN